MPDAVTTSLRARTALDVGRGRLHPTLAAQLLAIDETVRLHRPRQLDGEEPDQAQHWVAEGFTDEGVVAWLEAGVPWAMHARQLRDAGVTPREVGGQHEVGVTLGLAFARGEVTLDQVLAHRRPAPPCTGLVASWCPLHGTCTCQRFDTGERRGVGASCPLHGDASLPLPLAEVMR